MSSTPSRVTRSASRQPERAASVRSSTPKRATSDSAKKAAAASAVVKTPSGSVKKTKSGGDATPKRRSSVAKVVAPESPVAESSEDEEVIAASEPVVVRRVGSRASKRLSGVAPTEQADQIVETSVVADAARPPLVALIPHIAIYLTLATIAHFIVAFEFASSATQAAVLKALSSCSCLQLPASTASYLASGDAHDVAFFAVVPLYLLAGFLLRWGVALVVGPSARAGAFACALARMLSGFVFAGTLYAFHVFGVCTAYPSYNTLFVLAFAFVLQEFLLGFKQLSSTRRIYLLAVLAVNAYFGFFAYALEKAPETVAAAAPGQAATPVTVAAPALIVAINWARLVVGLSSHLAAVAQVHSFVGCSFVSTVSLALQSAVNFGVAPIVAMALYARQPPLFDGAIEGSSTFIETSIASFIMCALIFLNVLDSYAPLVTAEKKRA